jgi:hypothetical protein
LRHCFSGAPGENARARSIDSKRVTRLVGRGVAASQEAREIRGFGHQLGARLGNIGRRGIKPIDEVSFRIPVLEVRGEVKNA